ATARGDPGLGDQAPEVVVGVLGASAVAVGLGGQVVGHVVLKQDRVAERVRLADAAIAGVVGELGAVAGRVDQGGAVIRLVVLEDGAAALRVDGLDKPVAGVVGIKRLVAHCVDGRDQIAGLVVAKERDRRGQRTRSVGVGSGGADQVITGIVLVGG